MLTAEDLAYLRQAAARDGYNPDHALKVFAHESSSDPSRWGGKGGGYFGLFQAGAPERAQFGVDTVHPSARNQIDAFGRFLHARGYRPGMPLVDMYSTVLAGSPGHYNRSDGAGTVAQHVARMTGEAMPSSSGMESDETYESAPAYVPPPPGVSAYDFAGLTDTQDFMPSGSGDSAEVETQGTDQQAPEEDVSPGLAAAFSAQEVPLRQISQRALQARATPDLTPLSQVFTLDNVGRMR